jgi:flagellar motility protein MotE (MotC chaperone)
MKKIISMGVVVVVLFGLSAGASWMLQQNKLAEAEQAQDHEGGAEKGGKSAAPGHAARPSATGNDVATGLRPGYNPEADSASTLLASVKAEKEALKAREKQLVERRKALDLILLDVRTERSTLDELRKQLDEELKNATDKLEALEHRANDLDKQRKANTAKSQEISERWGTIADAEKDNYKHIAQVYENMEAEAAADSLQKMADSGKMEMASKVLALMGERKAAKLLAALPDKTLSAQLTEQMLKLINAPPGPGQKNK